MAGLVLTMDWTGLFINPWREEVEQMLSRQAGTPVAIGRLSGGLWGRVHAHDVRVQPSGEYRVLVDRATVRFDTLSLLKNFSHPDRALKYLVLNHPVVTQRKNDKDEKDEKEEKEDKEDKESRGLKKTRVESMVRSSLSSLSSLSSPSFNLEEIVRVIPEIRIRNGEWKVDGTGESLSGVFVSIKAKGDTLQGEGSLRAPGVLGSVLRVRGTYDGKSKQMTAELRTDELNLDGYGRWLATWDAFPLERCSGIMKAQVTFRGAWPMGEEGWRGKVEWLRGESVVKNTALKVRVEVARASGGTAPQDFGELSRVALQVPGAVRSAENSQWTGGFSGWVEHPGVGSGYLSSRVHWDGTTWEIQSAKLSGTDAVVSVGGKIKSGENGAMQVAVKERGLLKPHRFDVAWDDRVITVKPHEALQDLIVEARAGIQPGDEFSALLKGKQFEKWIGFSRFQLKGARQLRAIQVASLVGEQRGVPVVHGSLTWPLSKEVKPSGSIRGEGLDLAAWGLGVSGRAGFLAVVSGTREQPLVWLTASVKPTGLSASGWLKGASADLDISREEVIVRHFSVSEGNVRVSGVVRDPWSLRGGRQGEGVLRVRRAPVPWIDLKSADLAWRLEDTRLVWLKSPVHTAHGQYQVEGDMAVGKVVNGHVSVSMKRAWGKSMLSGQHDVSFQWGQREGAEVGLSSELTLDGKRLPPLNLSIAYAGSRLTIKKVGGGSYIQGAGFVDFGGKGFIDSSIAIEDLPLTYIGLLAGTSDPIEGYVTGKIRVKGEQPYPESDVSLQIKEGKLGKIELGECFASLNKSRGDAYAFQFRVAQGDQVLSSLGSLSWSLPTARKESFAKRAKIDMNWTCNQQSTADWLGLLFGKGYGLELSGMVSGRGRVYGTLADPIVKGDVTLQHGRVFGTPFEVVSASMDLERQELMVTEAKWQSQMDQLNVRGMKVTWQEPGVPAKPGQPPLRWSCDEIRLDPWNVWAFRLMGSLQVSGFAGAHGDWVTRVDSRDLLLNGYPFGPLNWKLSSSKGEFRVEEAAFSGGTRVVVQSKGDQVFLKPSTIRLPKGLLAAQGRVGPSPLNVSLKGIGVEAAFIVRALAVALDGEGTADFSVNISGDLGNPKVDGEMDIKDGRFELWPFQHLRGKFAIENRWMYLKPWVMSHEGRYTVTAQGKIPILLPSAEMALNVEIDDQVVDTLMPMGWFKSLEGRLAGKLHFAGTPGHPVMSGRLALERGVMRPKAFMEEIRDVKGAFLIQKSVGIFEDLAGTVEGIPMSIKGTVRFEDYDPAMLNVSVTTHGQTVAVNIPGIMEPRTKGLMVIGGMGDEWFAIIGRRDRPLYRGKVVFRDARFTWPPRYFEPADGQASGGRYAGEDAKSRFDFIKDFTYDTIFEVGDRLVYFNDFSEIALTRGEQLTYNGLGRRINISGELNVNRGTFYWLSHPFSIVSGRAVWTGDGTLVHMFGKAEVDYRGIKFTAIVRGRDAEMGTLENLDVRMSSEPPLSQQKIATLLTVGIDPTDMTDSQINQRFQDQFVQMMVRQGLVMGTKGLVKTFRDLTQLEIIFNPVEDPRYLYFLPSDNQWAMFDMEVGKHFTNRVYIGLGFKNYSQYAPGVKDWQQELRMDYNLQGQDFFRTRFSGDDIKILYERRFQF